MGLKLNPGGVIGALTPLALWGIAVILLGQEVASSAMMTTDVAALAVVGAMALGGAIGNSVWTSRRRARLQRHVSEPSGPWSLLLAFAGESAEELRAATLAELRALGADVDRLESGAYVVNVPTTRAMEPIRAFLSAKQQSGILEFRDRAG